MAGGNYAKKLTRRAEQERACYNKHSRHACSGCKHQEFTQKRMV